VVQEGDCVTSLADANGLTWQTLWNHNPDLQKLRKNPNALLPGDVILIPARRLRYEDRPTDQVHQFVRLGVPAKFRLILEQYDEPLANKRWSLTVDGKSYSGTTDGTGLLEVGLPPQARSGRLVVPDEDLQYDLSFGYLDPSDAISGAQARLQNLGFLDGAISGQMDDGTRDALLQFQTAHGLKATGELDDPTISELEQRHDNPHSQPQPESNDPPPEVPGEEDQPEEVVVDEAEDERRFQEMAQDDEED